ncbi:hypothetical protein [Motiliproteus sp. SC1-56]|uniref:hypothetical protein n=1 Tax=Motiliproteus sp. SC1-56 TaxID=2799565 RepID=UPI001A8D866A|nr:hypothetical protein [Motiliproteus sp. SC1-56]
MSDALLYVVVALLLVTVVLLSKLLSQLRYMTNIMYKTLNNTAHMNDIAAHSEQIHKKMWPIDEKLKNIQNILSANRAEKLGRLSDLDDY